MFSLRETQCNWHSLWKTHFIITKSGNSTWWNLRGGEHGIVSSLIDKLVEIQYGSLFTLVAKVITCRAERKSICLIFWLVKFERSCRISEFDSTKRNYKTNNIILKLLRLREQFHNTFIIYHIFIYYFMLMYEALLKRPYCSIQGN